MAILRVNIIDKFNLFGDDERYYSIVVNDLFLQCCLELEIGSGVKLQGDLTSCEDPHWWQDVPVPIQVPIPSARNVNNQRVNFQYAQARWPFLGVIFSRDYKMLAGKGIRIGTSLIQTPVHRYVRYVALITSSVRSYTTSGELMHK